MSAKARNIGIKANAPEQSCEDQNCPWHGSLPVRGSVVDGKVVSVKAQRTAIIEKDHYKFITKYERYERRKSRMVAYKPDCIKVEKGDTVRIAECRPLSKTKSFVVIEVLK